jgi:hypothetical protein|tara:strand:- start:4258 stop:4521 length:264 start_codon:yes stop_codon:yes gene_type:complete
MIGIPKGFKKAGAGRTLADITDVKGWTLSKGQRFFILEMKTKRPAGFPINIAIDNGFNNDASYPITAISEDDFKGLTKKENLDNVKK